MKAGFGEPGSRMRLADFQHAFMQALWHPDEVPAAIAPLAVQPGFAVYRNTVLSACIDALQANYPSVVRLVGEEWFRAAASCHVRQRPPDEPTLMIYGRGFADFLAAFEPAAELPYLADVARVDRLWSEAHVAPDAGSLEAAALSALRPEDLATHRFVVHPAARWAWSDEAPIAALWSRNRTPWPVDVAPLDDAPVDTAVTDTAPLDWRPEGILLTRPDGAVQHHALERAAATLLDACAAGNSIEAAVGAALAVDAGSDIGRILGRCIAAGAFTAVEPLQPAGMAAPQDQRA